MIDEKQLEETLHRMILEICEVLYRNGYSIAPVGAIMRLIGVPEERASEHDQDYFELNQDFAQELAKRKECHDLTMPPGTTLH